MSHHSLTRERGARATVVFAAQYGNLPSPHLLTEPTTMSGPVIQPPPTTTRGVKLPPWHACKNTLRGGTRRLEGDAGGMMPGVLAKTLPTHSLHGTDGTSFIEGMGRRCVLRQEKTSRHIRRTDGDRSGADGIRRCSDGQSCDVLSRAAERMIC